jgi:hypothetical protein
MATEQLLGEIRTYGILAKSASHVASFAGHVFDFTFYCRHFVECATCGFTYL